MPLPGLHTFRKQAIFVPAKFPSWERYSQLKCEGANHFLASLTAPGERVSLWRAVDQEGEVLESFVTPTRDKAAALTFMKKALKRHGSPEVITTDGLRSYKAAMNELGNAEKQEIDRWANNPVENSHLPFRRRERAMLRFRQMKTLQKFAFCNGWPKSIPFELYPSPATRFCPQST